MKGIAETVTDKTYLADFIGLINGVSAFIELDVKGRSTSKRNLQITDGRHTAILALWGDNACANRSHREPLIVLAMGCTFRTQDAVLTLTASYGSKAFLNLANLFSQQDHMYRSFC